jgi:acyl-CoA reductase-like NAD-dependent aldehyde dehydrogenase
MPFIVGAIVQNAGQTCSAGSRLVLDNRIYDEFTHRLADKFASLQVGASDMDLDVGPVINESQKRRIAGYVERGR